MSCNVGCAVGNVVRFGIQHVPQHLLPGWHAEHLARFTTTVKPNCRAAVAARLARTLPRRSPRRAAQQLGIPRQATNQPTGHYAALRERLDTYADQLTANIDRQITRPASTPDGRNLARKR